MFFASTFALLLTAILNLGAAQEDCAPDRDYTVVAGDTCDSICAAHGVSKYGVAPLFHHSNSVPHAGL